MLNFRLLVVLCASTVNGLHALMFSDCYIMMSLCYRSEQNSQAEGVCGRETPSGENFGMLAFVEHLHAQTQL